MGDIGSQLDGLFEDDQRVDVAGLSLDSLFEEEQPPSKPLAPAHNIAVTEALSRINPLTGMVDEDPMVREAAGDLAGAEFLATLGTGAVEFTAGSLAALGQEALQKVFIPAARNLIAGQLDSRGDIEGAKRVRASKRTPEEQRELAEQSRDFFRPIVYEPKSKAAQEALRPIEHAFELFAIPFERADQFYQDLGYPNIGLTLRVSGELAAFKGLHMTGKKALGWTRRVKTRLRKSKTDVEIEDALRKAKEEVSDDPKLREELEQADQDFEAAMRSNPNENGLIFRDQAEEIRKINEEQMAAVDKQRAIQNVLDGEKPSQYEVGESSLLKDSGLEEFAKSSEDIASRLEAQGNIAEATKVRNEADAQIMRELGILAAAENISARQREVRLRQEKVIEDVAEKAGEPKPADLIVRETAEEIQRINSQQIDAVAKQRAIQKVLDEKTKEVSDARKVREDQKLPEETAPGLELGEKERGRGEDLQQPKEEGRPEVAQRKSAGEVVELYKEPEPGLKAGDTVIDLSPDLFLEGKQLRRGVLDEAFDLMENLSKGPLDSVFNYNKNIGSFYRNFESKYGKESVDKLRSWVNDLGFQGRPKPVAELEAIQFLLDKEEGPKFEIIKGGKEPLVTYESPNAARKAGLDLYRSAYKSRAVAKNKLKELDEYDRVVKAGQRYRVAREKPPKEPETEVEPVTPEEIAIREEAARARTPDEGIEAIAELKKPEGPEDIPRYRDEINEVLGDFNPANPKHFEVIDFGDNLIEAVSFDLGVKERPEFKLTPKPKSLPDPVRNAPKTEMQRLEDIFAEIRLEESLKEGAAREVRAREDIETFHEDTLRRGGKKDYEELEPRGDLEEAATYFLAEFAKPLLNDRGAVDVSLLRDAIEAARIKKVSLEEYAKSVGLKDKHIRELLKQADRITKLSEFEIEAAMPETFEEGVIVNEKNRRSEYKNREGEVIELVKPPVYKRQFDVLKKNKDLEKVTILGDRFEVDNFITPQRIMERFSPELVDMVLLPYMGRYKAAKVRIRAEAARVRQAKKGLSVKEREELGIFMLQRDPKGALINQVNKQVPKKLHELTPRQVEAMRWLDEQYPKLLEEINSARLSIGKPPIPKRENYTAFFQIHNLADRMDRGHNFVLDGPKAIVNTYDNFSATPFHHVKPRSKSGLGPVVNDPFDAYLRYAGQAYRHVYISPILAWTDQARRTMRDPETGERYKLSYKKKNLDKFLSDWSRQIAEIDEFALKNPKTSKALNTLSNNLAFAILSGNIRSSLVQPAALANTISEIGLTRTSNAFVDILRPGTKLRHKFAFDNSRVLLKNEYDTAVTRALENVRTGKLGAVKRAVGEFGFWPLKYLDYEARIVTWLGAYKYGTQKGNLSDPQAFAYADKVVMRTQASAAPGALSSVQGTAAGRAATLFQTFAINNIGFLMQDVAGFKNPRVGNKTAFKKSMRYVLAATALNVIYQDLLQVQSPLPSPISAAIEAAEDNDHPANIAAAFFRELLEPIPLLGGIKFGASPLGVLSETANEAVEIVTPGPLDPRIGTLESDIRALEFLMKIRGVPGSSQLAKSRKAAKRGEDAFGIVMGAYTKK